MSDVPGLRLLLVHAHPDDESIGTGGVMARYVAEGRGVTLVTCTAGEMGEVLVPELAHIAADRDDTLGEHRREELALAMKELGVTDHRFLGGFGTYRDSGMKWHEDGHAVAADDIHDNAFWKADLTEAADHLVSIIREVRPQVLSTYDQFGNYGHPDHIQAHRVAIYGAHLAGMPSYRLDLGEPWQVAKVYWQAMSEDDLRDTLRRAREAGDTEMFGGMDPDGEFGPFATPDRLITTKIDGRAYHEQKVAAMRAHRTQIDFARPEWSMTDSVGTAFWSTEAFRLAAGTPGPVGADGYETDLFAGIEPDTGVA